MALSSVGWIDGVTGSLVVILGIVFAVFFYFQGIKIKSKMLKELAFVNLFAGLMYMGVLLDFAWLLATGDNFLGISNDTNFWVPVASYIWFPPLLVVAIYLAVSVQYPKYAKWAALAYAIVGGVFLVRMFQDPLLSFNITHYEVGGLIDYNLQMSSPAGIWMISMFILVIVVFCLGLIYHSSKTTGALKGKFIFLAIGAICYGVSGMLEGFVVLDILIIVVRAVYSVSFLIMYFGLKTIQA